MTDVTIQGKHGQVPAVVWQRTFARHQRHGRAATAATDTSAPAAASRRRNGPPGMVPFTIILATPWSGMNPSVIASDRLPQLWISDQS
jgi:hypothetical protein